MNMDNSIEFIPQNKVYDTNDIQVLEVCRGKSDGRSMVCFDCVVIIGDNRYQAKWYPRECKYQIDDIQACGVPNLLVIYVAGRKNTVQISDGVIKTITDKIN